MLLGLSLLCTCMPAIAVPITTMTASSYLCLIFFFFLYFLYYDPKHSANYRSGGLNLYTSQLHKWRVKNALKFLKGCKTANSYEKRPYVGFRV